MPSILVQQLNYHTGVRFSNNSLIQHNDSYSCLEVSERLWELREVLAGQLVICSGLQARNALSNFRDSKSRYRSRRNPAQTSSGGLNGAAEEIRKIEDFSRFLLPPLFSDLQDAAPFNSLPILRNSRDWCSHSEKQSKEAGPKWNQPVLIKAFRELWNDVVRLVVENLGGFTQQGSRMWWCPASLFSQQRATARNWQFLAMHAAGEYGHMESPFHNNISSYTPLLTVLMRACKSHDRSLSVFFVIIGQNRPAGALFILDSVEPELELVWSILPNCFYHQDNEHRCHEIESTSIVGTLWKVNDSTVQCLVEAFYKHLCGDGKMRSKRAARVLHRAVQSLARDEDMPLDQRIVFMHIGV
ncbi:hypothetical protein DFJ58DRAFT_837054 [Suillus subalutaceus]|uniref:uncharacterized protein n=1 Tax=Suillus subalutaceus TaxID=48586 RepID=UPI001B8655E8|nr:uncharacterized protein DFJ58DRAFT_837054 [Suillus subalutaceus]KAG1871727.1 hypothetical protein DFJ58DRAFT_837054 [Suillus subalutaceus]